jgi:hypothetical protein
MFRAKLTVFIQKLASFFTPTVPAEVAIQEAALHLSVMNYYPYFA